MKRTRGSTPHLRKEENRREDGAAGKSRKEDTDTEMENIKFAQHELKDLLHDPEFKALVQEELRIIREQTDAQFSDRVCTALEQGRISREWIVDPEQKGLADLHGHACSLIPSLAYHLLQVIKPRIHSASSGKWQCYGTPLSSLGCQIAPGECIQPFEEKECANPYLRFVYEQVIQYQRKHHRRQTISAR